MHAQAIDGSRQMQQTVERQYVCMVHSFREEGSFKKDVGNLPRKGSEKAKKNTENTQKGRVVENT